MCSLTVSDVIRAYFPSLQLDWRGGLLLLLRAFKVAGLKSVKLSWIIKTLVTMSYKLSIYFQNIKIKMNSETWLTLQSSVVIFQVLEPLQPPWPLSTYHKISDALSVGGCWGELMLLFWKLVDETQISKPQEYANTFKQTLTCIFLSVRVNLKETFQCETPCMI